MPHDIQVQADVGLTGHTGEGVPAGVVQRWDLQHVGTLKVCVGTAPGQPRATVPRVPTGINLRFSDWETSWKMLWGLMDTWGVQGTGANWFFKATK